MENTDEVRKILKAREADLQSRVRRHGEDSLDTGDTDVQDEIDTVASLEAKTAALELSTIEYQSLADVRAALQRLEDGTYGTCILCNEPIEPARLRAIPETPYCIKDAEAIEKEKAESRSSELQYES